MSRQDLWDYLVCAALIAFMAAASVWVIWFGVGFWERVML